MIVLSPEEMTDLDQRTIRAGYPEILLMEAAGQGVAALASDFLQENNQSKAKTIMIFVGKGNNGGDGLVAARWLKQWGYQVKIILCSSSNSLQGINKKNYDLCKLNNLQILTLSDFLAKQEVICNNSCLIIDSIFGTGLKGKVKNDYETVINLINSIPLPVLAVDIPSGIDGKTGKVLGCAVKADLTATMSFLKSGLLLYPGRSYSGRLNVIEIGIPARILNKSEPEYDLFSLDIQEAANLLPLRESNSHKGSYGKLLIAGGSTGMGGAPLLSAKAALKTGAGVVYTALPASIEKDLTGHFLETVTYPLADENGFFAQKAGEQLLERSEKMAGLVLGPGLGQKQSTAEFLSIILKNFHKPLLIDADGLNLIARNSLFSLLNTNMIITPHPGEFARLTGYSIEEIEQNRLATASEFAFQNQITVVLKGAATVIAFPDGKSYINQTGNAGMATAGSGDVLSGMIGSLIVQGLAIDEAALLGVYLHGLAGDLAAADCTQYCLTANDIIKYLPRAFKKIIQTES